MLMKYVKIRKKAGLTVLSASVRQCLFGIGASSNRVMFDTQNLVTLRLTIPPNAAALQDNPI
jgi:hypothetical protein